MLLCWQHFLQSYVPGTPSKMTGTTEELVIICAVKIQTYLAPWPRPCPRPRVLSRIAVIAALGACASHRVTWFSVSTVTWERTAGSPEITAHWNKGDTSLYLRNLAISRQAANCHRSTWWLQMSCHQTGVRTIQPTRMYSNRQLEKRSPAHGGPPEDATYLLLGLGACRSQGSLFEPRFHSQGFIFAKKILSHSSEVLSQGYIFYEHTPKLSFWG